MTKAKPTASAIVRQFISVEVSLAKVEAVLRRIRTQEGREDPDLRMYGDIADGAIVELRLARRAYANEKKRHVAAAKKINTSLTRVERNISEVETQTLFLARAAQFAHDERMRKEIVRPLFNQKAAPLPGNRSVTRALRSESAKAGWEIRRKKERK